MINTTDQGERRYRAGMDIRVLGPVELSADGESLHLGGPKQRAVLGVLISDVGNVVTFDRLADGVWGENQPDEVRKNIHTYVSNLRSLTGRTIEHIGGGYRLTAPADEIDATVFEADLDHGRDALAINPNEAAERLRSGLALWRGRPYADLVDAPGLQEEIRRLERLRDEAVAARIDADLELGRHRAVIGELEALTVEQPFNEGLRSRYMLALYRDGRQTEALRAFQQTRERLVEELGVEPSPELQELEARILQHDPSLATPGSTETREVAFLFTDIADSTVLWETKPDAMAEALARHDQILEDAVGEAGGRIFKHTGDGVMAAFTTVGAAARAAVSAQTALESSSWGSIDRLGIRASIDVGLVNARGSDFFGAPMNRGCRIMSGAHAGQIVMSADARRQIENEAGLQIKQLGEHRFKGIGAPVHVFQLVVDGLRHDFPELRTDGAHSVETRSFGDSIRGYELRERIGVGRFGIVYRAYQASVGREVAIKVIRPEFANHPVFVRRFEAEARLVAKLEHPHIVSLYDYWRDAEGAYLVMPYLAGRSLAGSPYGALPPERVGAILRQVGAGLSYAHRQGVIHRDIKLANLLLDGDGNAYLGDFGVAVRAVESAIGLTSNATEFRAPEDLAGGPIDERSDVYSLAAVTAALLTGDAASVDSTPESIKRVLSRGLEADPAMRLGSVDEFVAGFLSAVGTPVAQTQPAQPTRNPYKGLAAFDETDANVFFGREREMVALADLVTNHRLVTVVGPSGSGKSSLVRAGLIPQVRHGRLDGSADWHVVTMLPGAHPFDELATALGDVATERMADFAVELRSDEHGLMRVVKRIVREHDGDLLLVIDQFEELYTLTGSNDRDRFITSLVEATEDPHSKLRVVTTIRADFFDQPLSHDLLGEVVAGTHLALAVPDRSALHEAIVRPAEAVGMQLEPGLATRIVTDLRDQPGGLPLMQFVLFDLAQRADGVVTVADYEALGGVTGALSRRADDVYLSLPATDRQVAESMFLRLVTVDEDTGDVRRRVRQSELEALADQSPAVGRVLEAFGSARLLTFDRDPISRGPTVEIAHEALLREWDRYRGWIDARRAELVLRRRFALALEEWAEGGRTDDLLPTGGRLSQFEEWAEGERLGVGEKAFLDAAIAQRIAEETTRAIRRRRVMSGFAAAAVFAIFLAAWALAERRDANQNEMLAGARALVLEAEKSVDVDPELSSLLALEAMDRFDAAGDVPASAVSVLRAAVEANSVLWRVPGGRFVAVDAGGELLATRDASDDVVIWDIASRTITMRLSRSDGSVPIGLAFSPAGGRLAVAYENADQMVRIWDLPSRGFTDIGPPLRDDSWSFAHVLFSPDGSHLAFESPAETQARGVTYWSVDPFIEMLSDDRSVGFPFFASDGAFMYGTCQPISCVVKFIDPSSGVETISPQLDFSPLFVAESPDRNYLVTGDQSQLWLLDADTYEVLSSTSVDRVAFPVWIDDTTFAASGEAGIRLFDAPTSDVIREMKGLDGIVWAAAPVPGTDRIAAASIGSEETVIFSGSRSGSGEVASWTSPFEGVWTMNYADAAEGLVLASGGIISAEGAQGFAVLNANGTTDIEARGGTGVWFPWASRRGELITLIGEDGVWSARSTSTGKVIYRAPEGFRLHGITDDASRAVITTSDGDTRLVIDGVAGEPLDMGEAGQVIFDSSQQYIAVWDFTHGRNRILDATTGAVLATLDSGIGGLAVEFSWDSSKLIIGAAGELLVFDVDALLSGASTTDALDYRTDTGSNLILRLAVSHDDSMVATSAWSEPLKVWRLDDGSPIGEFGGELSGQSLHNADFHPTLPYLAVSTPPNVIRIHTLDIDELLTIARSRLTRGLTQQECDQFQIDRCATP